MYKVNVNRPYFLILMKERKRERERKKKRERESMEGQSNIVF